MTRFLRSALFSSFVYLAGYLPLSAQNAPSASLSVDDWTPDTGQTITLTGSYSDGDADLSVATICTMGTGNLDGVSTGSCTDIGQAPQSISGLSDSISRDFEIPSGTPTGVYTFRTDVEDSGGRWDSAWILVTVNITPTVSLSASSTSINAGQSVTLTATASDNDGTVSSVAFYCDNTLAATDTTSPYTYTHTNATAGTLNCHAVATDNDGGTTTSNTVTVTVNAYPTVSISSSCYRNSRGGKRHHYGECQRLGWEHRERQILPQ